LPYDANLKPRTLNPAIETASYLKTPPPANSRYESVHGRPFVDIGLGFDHGKSRRGKEISNTHGAPAVQMLVDIVPLILI
jgi:hypothetical protein